MKSHPSINEDRPAEDLDNPNDDGCVLGTAGRDEDPNRTTDWKKKRCTSQDSQGPDDTRGLPGYPGSNSEKEPGIETPEPGNDKPD